MIFCEVIWAISNVLGPEGFYIYTHSTRTLYNVSHTTPIATAAVLPITPILCALLTSALVLAFQSRTTILRFKNEPLPTCGHTKDNNKAALTGLLSTSLVLTTIYLILIWLTTFESWVMVVGFSTNLLSIVSIIVGLIGNCTPISEDLRARCFLAFFIMQIIHQLVLFGASIGTMVAVVSYFDIALALLYSICTQCVGPVITLAVQTRDHLISFSVNNYTPLRSAVN